MCVNDKYKVNMIDENGLVNNCLPSVKALVLSDPISCMVLLDSSTSSSSPMSALFCPAETFQYCILSIIIIVSFIIDEDLLIPEVINGFSITIRIVP